MIAVAEIRTILADHHPKLLPLGERTSAAVALILRETSSGAELLFIERAEHEDDPWSGDLGFPGGKVEPRDAGPREAAERETLEELGLDLQTAQFWGRLDDIAGAYLPVVVSCFVYYVPNPVPLSLNDEVTDAFWFPVQDLLDPDRCLEAPVRFGDRILTRPAIQLLEPGRTVLWGITYRLVCQFLEILGHSPTAGKEH